MLEHKAIAIANFENVKPWQQLLRISKAFNNLLSVSHMFSLQYVPALS